MKPRQQKRLKNIEAEMHFVCSSPKRMEAMICAARNLLRRWPSNGFLARTFNSPGVVLSATLFSRHSRARPFSSFASLFWARNSSPVNIESKHSSPLVLHFRLHVSLRLFLQRLVQRMGYWDGIYGCLKLGRSSPKGFRLPSFIRSPMSPLRTLRITIYGMLIMGPSQHLWFNLLSKTHPKSDMFTTFKKILAGQAIYGPCMNSIFFSYNAGLRGESRDEIVGRLKRDLLPTIRNGLMYWPVCDFLTFKFVPVHLQPLVNSSFAYVWTIYLTYVASFKKIDAN